MDIGQLLGKALGGLTGAGQKIAESILGTFSDDGALSMGDIGQLMLVFGLGEILGKDEPSKEAAKKLQKQFIIVFTFLCVFEVLLLQK